MAIPVVDQHLVYMDVEEGEVCSVFDLESFEGSIWLESITSFRFLPGDRSKAYTARKESGIYWYGCRKIAGKVRKKYIGKSSEVTAARLKEIAEALEIPPVPRVNKVAEVTQKVAEVAEGVAQEVVQDRLTALESQLVNQQKTLEALQKAVEALQEALPGKLEAGDSEELPKVDSEVAEGLQNDLGNLKAENEKLRADYAKLLESSTVVTNKLREEVQEARSQLETEKTRGEEIWEELSDTEQTLVEVRSENSELKKTCDKLRSQLEQECADREEVEQQVFDLKQKSAAASKDLLEAADVLNQLKSKRKKSKAELADVEKILEILEGNA
jgi:chromosome segregation ATPase